MRIQVVTHPEYRQLHDELTLLPQHFEEEGTIVYQGRNLIKALRIGGTLRNVKSFKIPHWLNRFVYAYFRPSKAKRSFTYANLLLAKGIGTPCPIGHADEIGANVLQSVQSFIDAVNGGIPLGRKDFTGEYRAALAKQFCNFHRVPHSFTFFR